MKRRLFTIVSVASMLICLTAAGLWCQNAWWRGWSPRARLFRTNIESIHGCIEFRWGHPDDRFYVRPHLDSFSGHDFIVGSSIVIWLESAEGGYPAGTVINRGLRLRYWGLVVLFGLPPAVVWIGRALKRRRERGTLCPTCGYDLRASKDKCPECGAAIPAVLAQVTEA